MTTSTTGGYSTGSASGGATGGGGAMDPAVAQSAGYSVARLRKQYIAFGSQKSAEINEQRAARHYYHGDQWTAQEQQTLQRRNQPILTNNRVGRKIDGIVGLVERLRQDPKGYPRSPNNEQGAELCSMTIRETLDAQNWQVLSSEGARTGGINGLWGVELSLEQGDHNDPEIGLAEVDPDTFFYDPRSKRLDFSDARYMGVAKWLDLEEAIELFPDKEDLLRSVMDTGAGDGATVQQQDLQKHWIDTDLERVFLVEHWYKKGGRWRFCFYVGTTEIESGESPWFDEKGRTLSRYCMGSVNLDHDGDRYGFVRNMKSAQDEVNARRSKALHQLNVRRIVAEKGAVDDVEKARKEAAKPDGYLEVNRDKRFEFDDTAKALELEGQLKFLEEAKAEIENFGPNPALIGQGIENKSGRAIALLQQAGIAELGPFILSYRGWKLRVYRMVWTAIERYWTAERWLRVTDDEDAVQFIRLNEHQVDEYGQPQLVNALGSLDVDIILDEGPDTMNLMQDTFDVLQTLAQNGVPVPPQVFLELSQIDSRTKKKVLAILSQPNPQQQIGQAQATANVEKTQAETAKIKTDAAAKVHDVLHEVASTGMGGDGGPPQPQVRPPSESISYSDLPPEAQSAMLAQAGINIHPAILAAHAQRQAAQAAAAKAASRPPNSSSAPTSQA